jgi:hypothetical protein
MAVSGTWVSALFASPEAALSWDGHWDEAEVEFRRLNHGGMGPNLIGIRQPEPPTPGTCH